MSDPIEIIRRYMAGPTCFDDVDCPRSRDVYRALAKLEAERALRPLRWYTDARDGLCPDEVSK